MVVVCVFTWCVYIVHVRACMLECISVCLATTSGRGAGSRKITSTTCSEEAKQGLEAEGKKTCVCVCACTHVQLPACVQVCMRVCMCTYAYACACDC